MLPRIAFLGWLCIQVLTAQNQDLLAPQQRANALRLAQQGRYVEAESILKELTKNDPADMESEADLAQLYYRFG